MQEFKYNMNEPVPEHLIEEVKNKEEKRMLSDKVENYRPTYYPNFKRLLLTSDGFMMAAHENIVRRSDEGDYLHPVKVRHDEDPEHGIEIDFWNETEYTDKVVTLRIQFHKGMTAMGWLCDFEGELIKTPFTPKGQFNK